MPVPDGMARVRSSASIFFAPVHSSRLPFFWFLNRELQTARSYAASASTA
jgi:hypothetical protein